MYTTINKSTEHFDTKLWSAVTTSITGLNFEPGFTWIKSRTNADGHGLYDAVRGAGKRIRSHSNIEEQTLTDELTAFNSDGFTLGTSSNVNRSGHDFVAWNWKAGTTSGLSGGTITPSAYSINAAAGFGVYKWTGNSTSGASIAHGLGKTPTMIMVKRLTNAASWQVYHKAMGNGKWIEMDSSQPQQTATSRWNDTSPTSTLFYLGNDSDVNNSSYEYVAYVFCDVPGYQKCSSYVGRGDSGAPAATGPMIYLGFKPKFILVKSYSNSGAWTIWDNLRAGYNPNSYRIEANASNAEYTGTAVYCDQLSNGFRLVHGDTDTNGDGYYYMYYALGQTLVGDNNTPCTAR